MSENYNVVDISEKTNYNGAGVYYISLHNKNGQKCRINRFLKSDKEGIIAIGATSNIEKRRKQFVRSSSKKFVHGHSEGINMALVKLAAKTDFDKMYTLKFHYRKTKDVSEAKEMEKELLLGYFKKYGELPPLNRNLPSRKEIFDELRKIVNAR